MQIYGVSFDMVGKQPIVLLKTVDGNKFLPIWIGHPEAAAILMKLQGASTPRPMTHDLLSDVLEQLDAKCERVSVTELRDNTFYASITVSINGSEMEIDSRPSDALALAVRVSAPIFAAEEVIEESAIEFEHEVEDTEEVVDKFKEFLDEVNPEDFAQGSDERFTRLDWPHSQLGGGVMKSTLSSLARRLKDSTFLIVVTVACSLRAPPPPPS